MEHLLNTVLVDEHNYLQPFAIQDGPSQTCMHHQQHQTNVALPSLYDQPNVNLSASQELVSNMYPSTIYHSNTETNSLQQQQLRSRQPSYTNTNFAGFSSSAFYSPLASDPPTTSANCSYIQPPENVTEPQVQSTDPFQPRFIYSEGGPLEGLRDPSTRSGSSLVVNSTLPSPYQPSHFQQTTISPAQPPPQQQQQQHPSEETGERFSRLAPNYMQIPPLNHSDNLLRQQQQQQLSKRSNSNYTKRSSFY